MKSRELKEELKDWKIERKQSKMVDFHGGDQNQSFQLFLLSGKHEKKIIIIIMEFISFPQVKRSS